MPCNNLLPSWAISSQCLWDLGFAVFSWLCSILLPVVLIILKACMQTVLVDHLHSFVHLGNISIGKVTGASKLFSYIYIKYGYIYVYMCILPSKGIAVDLGPNCTAFRPWMWFLGCKAAGFIQSCIAFKWDVCNLYILLYNLYTTYQF